VIYVNLLKLCSTTSIAARAERTAVQLSANAAGEKAHSATAHLAKVIMRWFMRATFVEDLFSDFARFCSLATSWDKSILEQVTDLVSALNLCVDSQQMNAASMAECGIVEDGVRRSVLRHSVNGHVELMS
jgi:hypothetical protein